MSCDFPVTDDRLVIEAPIAATASASAVIDLKGASLVGFQTDGDFVTADVTFDATAQLAASNLDGDIPALPDVPVYDEDGNIPTVLGVQASRYIGLSKQETLVALHRIRYLQLKTSAAQTAGTVVYLVVAKWA